MPENPLTKRITNVDLSVIIPTRQRPKKAAACVAALVTQHFEGRFEVLIGIDGLEASAGSMHDAVCAAWHAEREGRPLIANKRSANQP